MHVIKTLSVFAMQSLIWSPLSPISSHKISIKVILNRWLGVPIFLFVMYLMFVLAINIGGALQPAFEGGSEAIFIHGIQWLGATFNFPEWLTIFLAQGVGGGINTVLPLVPQIGMMYLFFFIYP